MADPTGFLESIPTYRLHSKPAGPRYNGLWVFSGKDESYENNSISSYDADTRTMIYDKIKSAFSKMDYYFGTIIQFWAPVTIGGKHLLSTSGQPFAVNFLDFSLHKYRRRCVEHVYDIDVNSNNNSSASAFLNRFPQIASIREVDPLLLNAFQECSLTSFFMMPIYCPSQTSSSSHCIGVVECSSWFISRLNSQNTQEVGLSVYNVQDHIPYKTINGLKLARDQIQEALKIVCQSHHIALAQVWIASRDENHGHFSSWEEAQTRRVLGLKLTGYDSINEDFIRYCGFQHYYDACDLIPLQLGEELVLKTLQDYEPRFCENISKLSTYKVMGLGSPDGIKSLTICMRSIHTADFNYVFEFLWEYDSFYPILLEEIILNLKTCLPNFKFASATEISDKLHVIELDNSTDEEIKKFYIFQAKRISPILEALKDGKKQVVVDYIEPSDTDYKTAPVLIPQQVIEQHFGTSTKDNFLENNFGNGNPMADCGDERVSDFLETLPTYILYKKPETEGALWVFCSEDEGSQKNSPLDDLVTRMIYGKINDKIKSAFSKVSNGGELIVQLWIPVTSGNRRVLSTSGQPFAVSDFGEGLEEYRRRCVGYECNIDMNNDSNNFIKNDIEQHEDRHPMTMIIGPPTNAFLNRLPETVLDTKNHREGSLMRYASDCGMWTSYNLPIGCPSLYYSSCIGVVECSSISSINLEIVNTMNSALEQEGLNVFNVQDRIPYSAINGLKLVKDEIQVALKIVCESHEIGVAQVWISYEDKNHVPFSFSSEDTQTTRRLALKLTGCVNEDSTACHWRFKEYYDACDTVPLKTGEELVEKTLQDNQPRFCQNISQLGTDTLMAWVSTEDVACSGFTICMSIDTGGFSCAFEFIWHHNPDYVPLLEALLLTLKRCLPRFNFASGAEIGDELRVIDVVNSTKIETKLFEIFKEKSLSLIPEAMNKGKKAMLVNYNARSKEKRDTTEIELSREDIEKHYGKTMKEAAEELGVSLSTLKRKHNKLGMSGWQGPDLPYRKAYNSNKNQSNKSHAHEKDNGTFQDPSPVKKNDKTVIKAEYADDVIKLRLGISELTFVTVENEIGKKFKLKHGTFKIKYLDEDEEWILMTSNQDLSDCIQTSRTVDRSAVRLRVLLHNQ